ncbi:MAG: hypothetical protein RhofKO_02710 [Rhodothermales bacterium]
MPPEVELRAFRVEGLALHAHHAEGDWFAASEDATPTTVHRLAHRFPETPIPQRVRPATAVDAVPLRALLERTADATLSLDKQVVRVQIEVQSRLRQTLLVNTDGAQVLRQQPLTELRAEVQLRHANGTSAASAQRAVLGLADDCTEDLPEQLARAVVEQAQRLATARFMPTAAYPVVLTSGWGGAWLHEVIGHRLEADVAAADGQLRLHTMIAPPSVTLIDDGTLVGGRATATHDDEGTPSARTALIQEGRCSNWLTDRAHADRLGLPRTGNGRRASYASPPLPRMTTLTLAPGTETPDALIETTRDGLFARQLGRGSVDLANRTYRVFVREGQRIERGRLTHPVADVWLEGALDDALHTIDGIATDSVTDLHHGICVKQGQALPIACSLPTTRLSSIFVRPS